MRISGALSSLSGEMHDLSSAALLLLPCCALRTIPLMRLIEQALKAKKNHRTNGRTATPVLELLNYRKDLPTDCKNWDRFSPPHLKLRKSLLNKRIVRTKQATETSAFSAPSWVSPRTWAKGLFTERPILYLSLHSVKCPLSFIYKGNRNQPVMREPVPFSFVLLLYMLWNELQDSIFTLMRGWNILRSAFSGWLDPTSIPIIERDI